MRVEDVISIGPVSSIVLCLCANWGLQISYLAVSGLQISLANNLKIRRCHINILISSLLKKIK